MKKKKYLLVFSIVIGLIFLVFSNKSFATTNNLVPSPTENVRRYIKRYSSLTSVSSGYMRVFYNFDSKKIDVEYYDNNLKITDKKHIDMELSIYGGFYAEKDAYYVVEGQNNPEEDTDKEVIRVIKYNTNWEKIGHSSITGNSNNFSSFYKEYAEIGYPFDTGCVEMTEINGKLYIATGHEGYVDDAVGQGHQGLLLIEVDEASLKGTVVDADLFHSFAQYVDNKDGNLYLLELSEGSERTLLSKYNTNNGCSYESSSEILVYGGERTSAWAVATYSSVDGIAVSKNNILSIGTSIDQKKYDSATSSTAHNIYLGVTPINDVSENSSKLVWLTDYPDKQGAGTCFTGLEIVKVNDNRFMVCWQEYEETSEMVDYDTLSTGVVHYVFIDENGNKLSKEYTAKATMSDCKPIVKDDKAVFYSSNGNMVDFYTIDVNNGSFNKEMYYVIGENASWSLDNNGVLTVSGEGDTSIDPDAGDIRKSPLSSTRGGGVYNNSDNCWKPIRSLIKKIVVNEGITSIADEKFNSFSSLTQVILPNSLKTIGKEAFSYCANLNSIYILSGVNSIGEDALWSGYKSYSGKKVYYATIYTYQGTYAEQWAKTNGVSYKYIDHIPSDDQIGWKKNGNIWYYYDENGDKKKDGKFKIDKKYYWFDKDGKMITTGWYKNPKNTYSEEWYYITSSGACAIGWQKVGKTWYYLNYEGEMYSADSFKINGKVYLFDKSGAMVEGKGWKKLYLTTYRYEWYYLQGGGEDTTCLTGWLKLGKYWYYFDTETGKMADDSQLAGGKVELFDSQGVWIDSSKKSGWFKYRGYWYYRKSGKISNGWEYIGKTWYYLDKNTGKMHDGANSPERIDNKYYIFDKSGAMKTGWIKLSKNVWNSSIKQYELKELWYYGRSSGDLYTEQWYKNYKGADYYFGYNGEMVANNSKYYVYDYEAKKGEYYSFDSEGRCTGKVN